MRGEPDRPWRPASLCARPAPWPPSVTTPLAPPIQPGAVYAVEGLDQVDALYTQQAAGYFYARDGHPNAAQLAAKLAELEGAEAALVCASGMAAEAVLFLSELEQGGHVALAEGLYGKTGTLIGRELGRFGVSHSLFDPARPETLRAVIGPKTRLVFVETLSNPRLRVADLTGLAEVAGGSGVPLAVDNTFAPLICRPREQGADVVVHSLTKLIGGHSDLTQGVLIGSRPRIERAAAVASAFGMTGNAFESWLCLRGLSTLAVRSERACATALELAGRLERLPAVRGVDYPGLASHPQHELARAVLRGGFGNMVTIDVGDRAAADRFIRRLRHIPFAPSLGDVSTTLSHPASTSHRGQSPEQWARQGITSGLIRLSIGLEDPEDLWDDLRDALGG